MLDFHTHILPGIDDGSEDVETSCKMMDMLKEQNVDIIVATPHFYYNSTSLEDFKEYRSRAKDVFLKELDSLNLSQRPKLALGAEVEFFYGLNVYEHVDDLCIEGTKYMLIEMPFVKWEHKMYVTLKKLKSDRGITPIIAHVERYFPFNSCREILDNLVDAGALIQCNTSFFTSRLGRRKAFSMYKKGLIQFIGTDCHNLTDRKPEFGKALDIISKKKDGNYIKDLKIWKDVFVKSGVKLY